MILYVASVVKCTLFLSSHASILSQNPGFHDFETLLHYPCCIRDYYIKDYLLQDMQ